MTAFVYVLVLLQLFAVISDAHLNYKLNSDISGAEYKASDGSKLFGTKKLPWKNLEYLDLRSNLLEGPVPAPSPNLKVLLISNNKFTGELPPLICNTSTLEVLDLSNNSIRGTIPECFGNFSNNMRVLDLRMNKFRGTIPKTFSNGSNLKTINFNGNELEGSVPKSFLNCTNLEVLDLGNNKIDDSFPFWLGTLQQLQVLVLRNNKFHGLVNDYDANYPFPKLRIMDISSNNFNGSFPAKYLENLKAMMDVDRAANEKTSKYMGETYYDDSVTLTVKGLEIKLEKILTIFTTIDFSNNRFHGEIPEQIGKLHSLRLLNLSRNLLFGSIPASLGNLKALESLDLSSNKLEGVIPNELSKLNFLSNLNLSWNNLNGHIPQGGQFNTFSNDSYTGNSGLCGLPMSKSCGSHEPQPPSSRSEDDSVSKIEFGWEVVAFGYASGTVFGIIMGFIVFSTGKPKWLARMVEGGHRRNMRRQKKKHSMATSN